MLAGHRCVLGADESVLPGTTPREFLLQIGGEGRRRCGRALRLLHELAAPAQGLRGRRVQPPRDQLGIRVLQFQGARIGVERQSAITDA